MAEYASAVIAATGKFPVGIDVQDSRSIPSYEQREHNQEQPPQTMAAPRRSTEHGNRTPPHKHQRQEDILREKIYEQQARMTHGRQCICDLGPVCRTISAHFAVLKDPRGKFVVLPSSQSPLRAAYCQYLCPDDDVSDGNGNDDTSAYDPASVHNDDDVVSVYSDYDNEDKEVEAQDSSDDDSTESIEGFYVAVHHFYPKVVEKYFGIKKDKKVIRPDHDLLPFPTITMTVDQRRACGIRSSRHDLQDRVMSHQLTASNNIYWIVPSYSLDKTRVDLEKATRRYLRKKSRRRRRSKSAKRRAAKSNHHHKQETPPVQVIGGNDDDHSAMTDHSETSDSTWGDDPSMQSSGHGEPFLRIEKASAQDGPLVAPESKKVAKDDDVAVDSDETVPNAEAAEEKSDSDTAENSCGENHEKSDDCAPIESIETHVQVSDKSTGVESKSAVVLSGRSIALRLVISLLCIISVGYIAMELSYHSGVLKADQAPEMLQSIRAKTKPVEEQIVASLEVQGRRLQSKALHAATVDMPIWKKSTEDRMYEAAAPFMRSLRSYLLIAVTVKAPQLLQILTLEAESNWRQLQPVLVHFLESSKSQWISFATVDGPRYLSQAVVGIQKAGKHVLQASAPLISSLQDKATSLLATEDGVSTPKGVEEPGANESICEADMNQE